MPTASTVVEGNPALNRVSWTNSGQQITVGDDMGKIWIYDVGEVSKTFYPVTALVRILFKTLVTYAHPLTSKIVWLIKIKLAL